jgi:lipopolysaccharide transport system permease protein
MIKDMKEYLERVAGFKFEKSVLINFFTHIFDARRSYVVAKHSIVLLYGQSLLGVLWQPMTLGITIFGIGVIFGQLFNIPVAKYLPFLCLGMIFWQCITVTLNQASSCFSNKGRHDNTRYDELIIYPIEIWAINMSQTLINLSIFVIVALVYDLSWGLLDLVAFFFGLVMFAIIVLCITILFSLLSAVYFDFQNIIRNLLQLSFFVTPIMWEPSGLQYKAIFLLNPIYHLIEIVRAPLLGETSSLFGFYPFYFATTLLLLIAASILWSGYAWIVAYKS